VLAAAARLRVACSSSAARWHCHGVGCTLHAEEAMNALLALFLPLLLCC
jgi:hypothetical protein